ncbi:MAG: VCBS repeat-containing protein [Prolixibacteraceae bacterium]|jgi:hypothetical protein|nr:VCBS repeat-containing protein [Prolixibacteraceae bacterium]
MKKLTLFLLVFTSCIATVYSQKRIAEFVWTRLSTEYGDFDIPGNSQFQTATLVADFSKNGKDEFMVVEKTGNPSVVMYLHDEGNIFEKYTIERRKLQVGESADYCDIDGDGDLDFAIGSEDSNEIWWWENPYPKFNASKNWKRRCIKKSGDVLHHDISFADFDGDGEIELAFWNQGCKTLFIAQKPEKVLKVNEWEYEAIFTYSTDGQMLQRSNGTELDLNGPNFHSGMSKADIDLDGITDIVTAGMWFKYLEGKYIANYIDLSYTAARIDAGQLIEGNRPEVVMVAGHGIGPLVMYQFVNNTWVPTILDKTTRRAHTLQIIDFDKDGDLDIFTAEMKVKEVRNPNVILLLNNGNGEFDKIVIANNFGSHNSGIGDVDGDNDLDIIGKPFAWGTPRIDVWLNNGK